MSDSASSVIETILDKNDAITLAQSRPCQRILAYLTRLLQIVRRQRGKPSVLDWTTHREMVRALPMARRDSEHLVNRIIEVAANPGCTYSRPFCLEVQYLPHQNRRVYLSRIMAIGWMLSERTAAKAPEIKVAKAGKSTASSQARNGG